MTERKLEGLYHFAQKHNWESKDKSFNNKSLYVVQKNHILPLTLKLNII